MWSLGAGLFLHVVRGDGKCLNTPRRAQTHTHTQFSEGAYHLESCEARLPVSVLLLLCDFEKFHISFTSQTKVQYQWYFFPFLVVFLAEDKSRKSKCFYVFFCFVFLSFPRFLFISSSCLFLCYLKKIPLIQSRPRWFSIALWYVTCGGHLNSSLQCLILYTTL